MPPPLYIIHLLAFFAAAFTGYGWDHMTSGRWVQSIPELRGYGFSLPATYGIWLMVVLLLYPLCAHYARFKAKRRHQWWWSYL